MCSTSQDVMQDHIQVDTVPSDYEGLVRDYGGLVERLVDHHNKVARNRDDLVQHVWVEILHRRVLQKYNRYLLGYRGGECIRPYWRVRQGLDPVATKKPMTFKVYLSATVRNIWKNWCRTHSRRYDREDPSGLLSDL